MTPPDFIALAFMCALAGGLAVRLIAYALSGALSPRKLDEDQL